MPLGPYPRLRLYGQDGTAPSRSTIRMISRIVPMSHLFRVSRFGLAKTYEMGAARMPITHLNLSMLWRFDRGQLAPAPRLQPSRRNWAAVSHAAVEPGVFRRMPWRRGRN